MMTLINPRSPKIAEDFFKVPHSVVCFAQGTSQTSTISPSRFFL